MLDYVFPQVLETRHSTLNGTITVVKFQGKIEIRVDNTEQSGPWVQKVWSKVQVPGKSLLILGFGAGSIATLFKDKKITGVEVDPEMVDLGKKYFPSKAHIIVSTAESYLKNSKKTFDTVLVDVYQGKTFPESLESPTFLKKLRQTMSKTGVVVFNRLTTKNANFEPEIFLDKLSKYFKIQKTLTVDFNTFIFCSRRDG